MNSRTSYSLPTNNLQGELWVPIIDMSEKYEVSNYGRARRITKNGHLLLGGTVTEDGYTRFEFRYLGKRVNILAHVLCARHFIGEKPDGNRIQVNHKDGIKSNNHVSNLEYLTHKANIEHAFRTGLRSREQIVMLGLVSRKVPLDRMDFIKESYSSKTLTVKELSKMFKVDDSTIYNIIKKRGAYKHV